MYLVVLVDAMPIMCKDLDKITAFKQALSPEFAIHDLGDVKDFLGCQVVRDREKRVLWMSSGPKDALVESVGLSGETRALEEPMSKSFITTARSIDSSIEEGVDVPLDPGHRCCELIGSLLYLPNSTKPDIAKLVGVLSQYGGTPTTANLQEAPRVVRYLKGTRH